MTGDSAPWAVVLAGGVGSRFWPLSTPARPKQLLPLVTDAPLIVETLSRLAPIVPASRTLVLTNGSLVPAIAAALPDLPRDNLIAEPKPAGTAAALAWGALEITRRSGSGDTVMVSVHADWSVADADGFRAGLRKAIDVARSEHRLVTVGVVPTRAETGFGYIRRGRPSGQDVFHVDSFVEKPDAERAKQLIADGCLWNSGIFVWRASDFLVEVERHSAEVAPALKSAGASVEQFFSAVTPISVDQGVLERSDKVSVIPGDFGWDDVGTWASLHRVREHDDAGNAIMGPVHVRDARGNVVHAEGNTVVLYGVDDLVVVARDGMVMVTTRERSSDLKALLDALPKTTVDRT